MPVSDLRKSSKDGLLDDLDHHMIGRPGPDKILLPASVPKRMDDFEGRIHPVGVDKDGRFWRYDDKEHALVRVFDTRDR